MVSKQEWLDSYRQDIPSLSKVPDDQLWAAISKDHGLDETASHFSGPQTLPGSEATYKGMQTVPGEGSFPLFDINKPGNPLHGSTVGGETVLGQNLKTGFEDVQDMVKRLKTSGATDAQISDAIQNHQAINTALRPKLETTPFLRENFLNFKAAEENNKAKDLIKFLQNKAGELEQSKGALGSLKAMTKSVLGKGMDMGAFLPPNLDELATELRNRQFNDRGGT